MVNRRTLTLTAILLIGILTVPQSPLSVIGVDQVQYDSNSEFFNGETLLVNYVADQNTEEINAFFSENELQSSTGENIEQSLEISARNTNTQAQYSFQEAGLRDLVYVEALFGDNGGLGFPGSLEAARWAENNCYDISGDGSISSRDYATSQDFFGDYYVYCTRPINTLGNAGDISTPQPIFNTEFTVKASGKTSQSCTVSNNDVGNGRRTRCTDDVLIEWNGLNQIRNAPVADDELILQSNDFQYNFRVISEARYTNWRQEIESSNGLKQELEAWSQGEATRTDVNDINNQAADAYTEFSSSPLVSGSFTGTNIDSGSLELETDYELLWPEFTVYIDGADYITVSKPVGQPRITSTRATEISEIGGGRVYATVENTATNDGVFDVRVSSCTTSFTPVSTTKQTSTLGPGESEEIGFQVGFSSDSSSKEVDGSCTLEAVNSDGSTRVTSSQQVTGVQENECVPGSRFETVVDGMTAVQACGSDGFPGQIVDVCGDEQGETGDTTVVDGDLVCETQENKDDGGGLLDGFRNPFTDLLDGILDGDTGGKSGALFYLDLFISFLAATAVFGFARNTLADIAGVTSTRNTLIFAAVVGVMGAFVVYQFISILLVKILIIAALLLYGYLQSLIPGV